MDNKVIIIFIIIRIRVSELIAISAAVNGIINIIVLKGENLKSTYAINFYPENVKIQYGKKP